MLDYHSGVAGPKRLGRQNGRQGRQMEVAVEVADQPDACLSVHQITWRRLPKCGARTRQGRPCLGLATTGRRRCRMHGGAAGSGAPLGNRNAWRHGRRSRAAGERRLLQRLVVAADAALMADLRIVDIVARGAVEEFDAAVQHSVAEEERLRQAAARLERLLAENGRIGEARALADEVAQLTATRDGRRTDPSAGREEDRPATRRPEG